MVFTYYFTIDHVHDGDTFFGILDKGLAEYVGRSGGPLLGIRFYGINCPELNDQDPTVRANAEACRDYLMGLVKPGDILRVESYTWDEYRLRIDAIPYLADGTNLCQAMLSFGHGTTLYQRSREGS